MILVDSSVWINYFNGKDTWQTDTLDFFLQKRPVLLGDLILAEVLQGFSSDKDFKLAQKRLDILPFQVMGSYRVALQSAVNYRFLRKKGITPRKTIDVIIGTFCILENIQLLHDDHDFDTMAAHLSLKIVTNKHLSSP